MEQLEVEIDSLAFGGRGVARADGYVVFVAGALPGDRVRAKVTKSKRSFAEATAIELLRARRRSHLQTPQPPGRTLPRGPLAGAALPRANSPTSSARSMRRCAESAASTGFALGRDRPRGLDPGATATSLSTPSARHRGPSKTLGFHASRPLGPDRRRRGLQTCLRARKRGAQCGSRVGAIGEPYRGLRSPRVQRRRSAQPGRPRGKAQRPDPDPPGSPRRPPFRDPPLTSTRRSRDPSGGTDGPTGALGEERLREQLCGLALEISLVYFFQTNTEMAEQLHARVIEDFACAER